MGLTKPPLAPQGVRGGGSGGQGRIQGRQHSDVGTARLPVSTQTLRVVASYAIGEGQLDKELILP
jgi:hypothetical protein